MLSTQPAHPTYPVGPNKYLGGGGKMGKMGDNNVEKNKIC